MATDSPQGAPTLQSVNAVGREVWHSEIGKACLTEVCLLQRDGDGDPLVENGTVKKHFLQI